MRTAIIVMLLANAAAAYCDEAQNTAKRYFREANTQFQLGHYAEAAKEFEAGYELDPRPGFLWNLAQCYRKLGDNEKALHFYKQYVLNAKPGIKHAANVEEAQHQIKILEPLVAAQKKASAAPPDGVVSDADTEKQSASPEMAAKPARALHPVAQPAQARRAAAPIVRPPSAPSEQEPSPWYKNPLGWTIASVGLAGIAASIGLLVHGSDLNDEITSAASRAQAESLQADRGTFRTAGYATLCVGAAAVAAGAVVFGVVAARHRKSRFASIAPSFDGRTMVLDAGGSW